MARRRYTEEQVIALLKRHEQGVTVPDLAREINVSETTIYKWLAKYGGMRSRMPGASGRWRMRTAG
jgi:putative transposase